VVDTLLSVVGDNLEQNHYLQAYQDSYYNCVKVAGAFLDKETTVCGTIQANRGLPSDLLREAKC
jgi:hypothetical protein